MYKRGSIVLVPFPFTDLTGNKARPAVIISKRKIGCDVVVVFITSKLKTTEKHLVAIAPDAENGLKTKSKIVCAKLATIDTKIILGELGNVSDTVQAALDRELQKVLGL